MQDLGSPGNSVVVRAPGKINLILRVGPLRSDGYHELLTVFQAVDIWETVTVQPAEDFSITVSGGVNLDLVPRDATNIAIKAAKAVARRLGRTDGVAIHIDKKVPVGGGMGGGSADAAATLIATNELWDGDLSTDELLDLAASLGSDVPFLLHGGTAVARGRGEKITEVESLPLHWVVVPSLKHLATPQGYARLDEIRDGHDVGLPSDVPADFMRALAAGDPMALAPHLINDMAPAAISLHPEVATTLEMGIELGALTAMVSGSGPTCVLLARDLSHAHSLVEACATRHRVASVVSSPVRGTHLVSPVPVPSGKN
jgi:4-diphosphocytidyl-2-C-methyl-D-erythritol kinase